MLDKTQKEEVPKRQGKDNNLREANDYKKYKGVIL